jgi:tRNA pseudouridine38/39 synthase
VAATNFTKSFVLRKTMDSHSTPQDYSTWSPDALISRITELETQLKSQTASYRASLSPPVQTTTEPALPFKKPKAKSPKTYDPSKYSTRLVAFKFAYLGAGYQGLEHHVGNVTELPTVEDEVWKALVKTRLIFPPSLQKRKAELENGDGPRGKAKGEGNMRWLDGLRGGDVPVDWEGCDYSKCGRTDRGVSAFGQVVGLRVRSARPMKKRKREDTAAKTNAADVLPDREPQGQNGVAQTPEQEVEEPVPEEEDDVTFDSVEDEIPYVALLNRVLPPTIRMLAWCPSTPPNFDARFSCKERLYRYFFTNPAYLPLPGSGGIVSSTAGGPSRRDGWLDIEAMREAASLLVGSHDFRNFSKLDPSKQLTSFARKITHASIEFVAEDSNPSFISGSNFGFPPTTTSDSPTAPPRTTLYSFNVRGSAFLWHQVRCMVGILFHVGQGLEKSSIVTELLDVSTNPRRPAYEMASDKPLVLWDSTFSKSAGKFAPGEFPAEHWDRGTGEDELEWVYAGDGGGQNKDVERSGKWGRSGIMEDLWRTWRGAKMDEVLAGQLLDLVASQGSAAASSASVQNGDFGHGNQPTSTRVFCGEDHAPYRGKYVPVMQRERLETVEVQNARWLARKGATPRTASEGDG